MESEKETKNIIQAGRDKSKETRIRIISAGRAAVNELIKVAEEPILGAKGTMIVDGEDIPMNSEELSADKLKNAAATKKLSIFDAFEILKRIEEEEELLSDDPKTKEEEKTSSFGGFAEKHAKKK
jgi:hypothetical protein